MLIPCTPRGVIELLDASNITIEGNLSDYIVWLIIMLITISVVLCYRSPCGCDWSFKPCWQTCGSITSQVPIHHTDVTYH